MLTRNGQIRLVRELAQDNRSYHVGLFDNDYTPTLDTQIGDLNEASFNGYGRELINTSDWDYPVDDSGVAVTSANLVKWTSSESVAVATIYGYFILDVANELVIVRRFAGPQFLGPAESLHLFIKLRLNG